MSSNMVSGSGSGRSAMTAGKAPRREAGRVRTMAACIVGNIRTELAPNHETAKAVPSMKYWEIIANNLASHGWSWGLGTVTTVDGSTIFVADAHRDDGKRLVVRGDNLLNVFVDLERSVRRS